MPRLVVLALLSACHAVLAQDLPDPGRRLSKEEQEADPEKRPAAPKIAPDARRTVSPHDAQACKNARIYYQLSCGAPGTDQQFSRSCTEAYALYRQNCP